jgi:hypothetical protein
VNVLALQVLYDLGFDSFCVGRFNDADRDGDEFRGRRERDGLRDPPL